jgi:hypothetical protein
MKNTILLLSAAIVALHTASSFAATYQVTNLNDAGAGSLRQSIVDANSDPGSTVTFAVAGTIVLSKPLPPVTGSVTLDGTTAPGFVSSPVVAIDFAGKPGLTLAPGSDRTGMSWQETTSGSTLPARSQQTMETEF